MSDIKGPWMRGSPFLRWKNRIKEYMLERGADVDGGIEQAKKECVDKERWPSLWPSPWVMFSEGTKYQQL